MIEEKYMPSPFVKNCNEKSCVDFEITEEEKKKANDFVALFQAKGKCKRGFEVDHAVEQIFQSKGDPIMLLNDFRKICEESISEIFNTPKKPKIQDYTTFFEILRFPIRFKELKITNIRYCEGFFFFVAHGDLFCIIDDSNDFGKGLIQHLLAKGYKIGGNNSIQLMDENQTIIAGTEISINLEVNYPMYKIEQLFFAFKHVYHYVEYLLWSEISNYSLKHPQTDDKQKKWLEQDKKLVNLFKTSVDNLYNSEVKESSYKFTFKFDEHDLNPDIINKIYDKYLFSRAYDVEKKAGLYNYTRFGQFKIAND